MDWAKGEKEKALLTNPVFLPFSLYPFLLFRHNPYRVFCQASFPIPPPVSIPPVSGLL
jgi:hypothetical protein